MADQSVSLEVSSSLELLELATLVEFYVGTVDTDFAGLAVTGFVTEVTITINNNDTNADSAFFVWVRVLQEETLMNHKVALPPFLVSEMTMLAQVTGRACLETLMLPARVMQGGKLLIVEILGLELIAFRS